MRRFAVVLPVFFAFLVGAAPASAWTWPVEGPVVQSFSLGDDPYAAGQHRGIDIGAPTGTSVRAPAGGTVSFAGSVPRGGLTVTIRTPDGYAVTLLHLGGVAVGKGQELSEGEVLGTVGPSGEAEHAAPYVHLGIRVAADDNGYLDPMAFLPPLAIVPPPTVGEDGGPDAGLAAGASGSGAQPVPQAGADAPPPSDPQGQPSPETEPPEVPAASAVPPVAPVEAPSPTAAQEPPTVQTTGAELGVPAPPTADGSAASAEPAAAVAGAPPSSATNGAGEASAVAADRADSPEERAPRTGTHATAPVGPTVPTASRPDAPQKTPSASRRANADGDRVPREAARTGQLSAGSSDGAGSTTAAARGGALTGGEPAGSPLHLFAAAGVGLAVAAAALCALRRRPAAAQPAGRRRIAPACPEPCAVGGAADRNRESTASTGPVRAPARAPALTRLESAHDLALAA
jgi:hypothetical protein